MKILLLPVDCKTLSDLSLILSPSASLGSLSFCPTGHLAVHLTYQASFYLRGCPPGQSFRLPHLSPNVTSSEAVTDLLFIVFMALVTVSRDVSHFLVRLCTRHRSLRLSCLCLVHSCLCPQDWTRAWHRGAFQFVGQVNKCTNLF